MRTVSYENMKNLPKDWYDKFERLYHINSYSFQSKYDALLYLKQQCHFTETEAQQFILSLEKI